MNIKALITSIALFGTSSVAMARPTFTASAEASWSYNHDAPVVRDHRTTSRPVYRPVSQRPVYDGSWNNGWNHEDDYAPRGRMLGFDLQFGDTEYRKDIIVGSAKGAFRTLTVDAEGGRTYIQKIGIEFTNGQVQVVNVDRVLAGRAALTIDLDGGARQIGRIFVYRMDGADAYNINKRHNGAFTVSAF